MRIGIVCYENPDEWILGKFAKKLVQYLPNHGVQATLIRKPEPGFDINHHLIYSYYNPSPAPVIDTVMITHIHTLERLSVLKEQLKTVRAGICMSKMTMQQLIEANLPADRLAYVNPAQDGIFKPRKIVIGLSNKVHPDGRTRNTLLSAVSDRMDLSAFSFTIMGTGWGPTIEHLRKRGAEAHDVGAFNYERYAQMMPSLDYFMYLGEDEGSMAFLDAVACGVKTIATPQGFHLDAENAITHPFTTVDELQAVLTSILEERQNRIAGVTNWTWDKYAKEHAALWGRVLRGEALNVNTNVPPLKKSIARSLSFYGSLAKGSYLDRSQYLGRKIKNFVFPNSEKA